MKMIENVAVRVDVDTNANEVIEAIRAQRIRDIVGVQWATAILLERSIPNHGTRWPNAYQSGIEDGVEKATLWVCELPCAEDIVDGRAP